MFEVAVPISRLQVPVALIVALGEPSLPNTIMIIQVRPRLQIDSDEMRLTASHCTALHCSAQFMPPDLLNYSHAHATY